MKEKLQRLTRFSKQWWRLNQALLEKKERASSVSSLKEDADWVLNSTAKAELLSATWQVKCVLPESIAELPHDCDHHCSDILSNFLPLRRRVAYRCLK